MAAISKESFFVKLLAKKTKIKTEDIIDILKAIPGCMAEAFLEANPVAKEAVYFGINTAQWKHTPFGPTVVFSPTKTFKERMVKLKLEQNYPLAKQLYDLMMPITQQRVAEKAKKGRYDDDYQRPQYKPKTVETPEKRQERRIKTKEKRKKQAILLKCMD